MAKIFEPDVTEANSLLGLSTFLSLPSKQVQDPVELQLPAESRLHAVESLTKLPFFVAMRCPPSSAESSNN